MTHPNGRPAAPPRPGDYLTVGRVAKAIGVSTRTVGLWADCGLLRGVWRLPSNGRNGGQRRIPVGAAVALCHRQGRAVPREWRDCRPAVLLVGLTVAGLPDDYAVHAAADPFAAGLVVEAGGTFAAVVVDAGSLGSDVAAGMLAAMRKHPRLEGVPIAVSVAEDDNGSRWQGLADRVLRGPVGAGDVAGVVEASR